MTFLLIWTVWHWQMKHIYQIFKGPESRHFTIIILPELKKSYSHLLFSHVWNLLMNYAYAAELINELRLCCRTYSWLSTMLQYLFISYTNAAELIHELWLCCRTYSWVRSVLQYLFMSYAYAAILIHEFHLCCRTCSWVTPMLQTGFLALFAWKVRELIRTVTEITTKWGDEQCRRNLQIQTLSNALFFCALNSKRIKSWQIFASSCDSWTLNI